MDEPRKYHCAWWRLALLLYPMWLACALLVYFLNGTTSTAGLIEIVLGLALLCSAFSLITLLSSISVDSEGLILISKIGKRRIAWNSILAVKPVRLPLVRDVMLTRDDGVPLTLMLGVMGYASFREEVMLCAPIDNPLRVYLESGEIVTQSARLVLAMEAGALGQAAIPAAGRPSGGGKAIPGNLKLERAVKGCANWFFIIAGLSLVNMIFSMTGDKTSYWVGLAATQIVEAFCRKLLQAANSPLGGISFYVTAALNLCIAGVFVLLGVLARKKRGWAFTTGFLLYALDAALMLMYKQYPAFAWHVLVLLSIIGGYRSLRKLKSKEAEAACMKLQ